MFRNILVHIPSERPVRPVIDVAVALAIARRSHLDAVAIGYESMSAAGMIVEGGGAAVAAMIGAEQERAQERADAAIAVFEARGQTRQHRLRHQDLRDDSRRGRADHRGACPALRHDDRAAAGIREGKLR